MSSAGANKESPGGTMKNVIDNPETKPESHKYAEDQADTQKKTDTNTKKGNEESNLAGAGPNQESPGGTMKNVIDNPGTKPESHKFAEEQAKSNTQQANNKCSSGGPDHKAGESSCNSCQKK